MKPLRLRRSDALQLAALLLLACLLRGAVLWLQPSAMQPDPDAYRSLAVVLAQHGVFGGLDAAGTPQPTAFRPPLYPWLLSWLVADGQLAAWRIALLHWLLGIATVAGTYVLGRRLIGRGAWLAGLLVLVDPLLLVQSTQVMTETLATALAVAVWVVWVAVARRIAERRGWVAATVLLAVLLGLAFLCRPTFIVWAGLLCVWLIGWSLFRRDGRPAAAGCLVLAVLAATVGGWTERNRRAVGQGVWATSHGGYTLLLGNNPLFYDYLRSAPPWGGDAWDAAAFHRAWASRYASNPLEDDFWHSPYQRPVAPPPAVDDELADDALAYGVARQAIARDPLMFGYAALVRIARLWSPIPHRTPDRHEAALVAIAAFYLLWLVAVVYGVWRQGLRLCRTPWAAGMLLALSLTAVHAVYWSNLRMRAPAVPWLALVAAAGMPSRSGTKEPPE